MIDSEPATVEWVIDYIRQLYVQHVFFGEAYIEEEEYYYQEHIDVTVLT